MSPFRRFLSLRTPKFNFIERASAGKSSFRILDVGSGNHSPSKIKTLFPGCEYHGIDLDKEAYSYNEQDDKAMTAFYQMNLTELKFDAIPDDYFDVITMAHIIEHLFNGDEVVKGLSKKLKKGGYIYIEYPGEKSTRLPSMNGTLNFKDDSTHVRVYSVPEMKAVLSSVGITTISAGMRRSWFYIAAIPFRLGGYWLRGKKAVGNVFWDLLGFAEYLFARKN